MTTAGPELPAAPRTLEELFTETVPAPLLLLVVGPPRAATAGSRLPATVAADLVAASLELLRRGHVPLVAEAMTLPWAEMTLAATPDDASQDVVHLYAHRLLEHCDGVVRVGGASAGADEMAALGAARGARVWTAVEAVPHVAVPHVGGTHPA